MDNLTPRQRAKITVAEQAEAHLQEQARNQEQRGGSLSAQNYDETGSRSEWAEQWE